MLLLALDLGQTWGWSRWHSFGGPFPGFMGSGYEVSTKPGDASLGQWRDWLRQELRAWDYQAVAYEEPGVFRSVAATRSIYGRRGILHAVASGAALHTVTPSQLKKWATGSGKASKSDMVMAARRYKGSVKDHNEADAILVGAMVAQRKGNSNARD